MSKHTRNIFEVFWEVYVSQVGCGGSYHRKTSRFHYFQWKSWFFWKYWKFQKKWKKWNFEKCVNLFEDFPKNIQKSNFFLEKCFSKNIFWKNIFPKKSWIFEYFFFGKSSNKFSKFTKFHFFKIFSKFSIFSKKTWPSEIAPRWWRNIWKKCWRFFLTIGIPLIYTCVKRFLIILNT